MTQPHLISRTRRKQDNHGDDHRQTERQTNILTDRQTYRQADGLTRRQAAKRTDRHIQKYTQTDGPRRIQTGRQKLTAEHYKRTGTNRQGRIHKTDTHTHAQIISQTDTYKQRDIQRGRQTDWRAPGLILGERPLFIAAP